MILTLIEILRARVNVYVALFFASVVHEIRKDGQEHWIAIGLALALMFLVSSFVDKVLFWIGWWYDGEEND